MCLIAHGKVIGLINCLSIRIERDTQINYIYQYRYHRWLIDCSEYNGCSSRYYKRNTGNVKIAKETRKLPQRCRWSSWVRKKLFFKFFAQLPIYLCKKKFSELVIFLWKEIVVDFAVLYSQKTILKFAFVHIHVKKIKKYILRSLPRVYL